MSQVIRVSKLGVNVGTATNPNDFIFNSDYNTFKILGTGVARGTINLNTVGTITTTHEKSFIPPIMAFAKQVEGTSGAVGVGGFDFTPRDTFSFRSVSADGTTMYFEIKNTSLSASGTYDVSYFIFESPL